jgi:two-component system, chemotaxis family, chemotaxis protein CheY
MAKILVVDDSRTIRTLLNKTFTDAGHQVLEAVDGGEGLSKAIENPDIALILSDINMPRMDGLTMCAKIKAAGGLGKIPIFIVSTEIGAEMKATGRSIGVTAWMTKPPNCPLILEAAVKVLAMTAKPG